MALASLTEPHAVAREARPLNSLLNPWLTCARSYLKTVPGILITSNNNNKDDNHTYNNNDY